MCSIEVKNTLFRSFCTQMYTCQLWYNFSVHSMHKLNVAYNNAFRFMHHLPTYCSASLMFVVNRVPNCRAVIRNRIYGFMKRLVSSSNALVLSTVTSDARFRSKIVQFSNLVSCAISIIMLVSGYNNIILLPNCTILYYVFSGPLSLRAYVPEIKFNLIYIYNNSSVNSNRDIKISRVILA